MDYGKNSDNGFGKDPKPPQSDIDAGQTKVGNTDAACPPGRVPSSTSATGALPRVPAAAAPLRLCFVVALSLLRQSISC